MKKFLTFIDFENEFKKFKSIPTWTKKKYSQKEKLFKFLNNHESLYYEIDYCRPMAEARKRWSYGFFEVPTNKRGNLKKYRGLRILVLNVRKPNQFKMEIGCYPLKKTRLDKIYK